RGESLNLILQSLQHVYLRPVGHMTISPCRMFAPWSARAVEETRLNQQYERTLGVTSGSHRLFRRSNLLKASSQMHRCCSQATRSFPRNRCVQRVVHFEDAGAVAISFQSPFVVLG